mmetsp:Transcript_9760/g.27540  ORF Transcript_9760/g.27540 Transcript_9760/m.27540 type:complete len:287 (-) Transcript_9760:135-995(-)
MLFQPLLPLCLRRLLGLLVALLAHVVVAVHGALIRGPGLAAHVAVMAVGQLHLRHAVALLALHMLRRLLPSHLVQSELERVEAEASYTDHEHGQEDHPHLRIVGLLAAAATLPAFGLLRVLLLAHDGLERALLRDHLQGLVLALHPVQAALEEDGRELLGDALLPLARGAAGPGGVGQLGVVRAGDGDEAGALALGGVDLDVHIAAGKGEAEEGRHLVRLRAVWGGLAALGLPPRLLVLLHLVEDVLLHSGQVAPTAIDALTCCRLAEGEERQWHGQHASMQRPAA